MGGGGGGRTHGSRREANVTNSHSTTRHPRPMGLPEWGMLILLGAIWGGSFFLARIAVAEIAPLTLVLLRVGIAALPHLYLLGAAPPLRWPCRIGRLSSRSA